MRNCLFCESRGQEQAEDDLRWIVADSAWVSGIRGRRILVWESVYERLQCVSVVLPVKRRIQRRYGCHGPASLARLHILDFPIRRAGLLSVNRRRFLWH